MCFWAFRCFGCGFVVGLVLFWCYFGVILVLCVCCFDACTGFVMWFGFGVCVFLWVFVLLIYALVLMLDMVF